MKLSWNKHHTNKAQNKTEPEEQKINKVVEDNSIMLDRMKNVSSACDTILQTFDTIADGSEVANSAIIEPQFLSTEPTPQLEESTQTPDLKSMLKKDLLKMAQELGCDVKSNTTKANIIKAIQAA